MKTLLIAGTYAHHPADTAVTTYDVNIYGQTPEAPTMIFITAVEVSTRYGYSDLVDECKKVYCKYFQTDDYNIITLDKLTKQA